jgi:hypothetical protein
MIDPMPQSPTHFKGKDAIGHVAEAQAKGIIAAFEIHGTEIPGHISAGADASRDTCAIFLLLIPILMHFQLVQDAPKYLIFFLLGWIAWRAGRAAWLGWARLERLHRVLEQEKWEIEHNRPQERDELRELYRAKGFEGKLLEDVLDVLMADSDRLLRVMVEEELGLSLQKLEHPLKQGLGAGLGALASGVLLILALFTLGPVGLFIIALVLIGVSAAILAYYARNRMIPAITWNAALAVLAFGLTYYTLQIFP